MPRMSFGVGSSARLSSIVDESQPTSRSQTRGMPRRRLEDAVEEIFYAALQRGDLPSAEDLLGVMENMHARARVRFQAQRRGTEQMIERCRKELEGRRTRRRFGPG